MFPRLGPLPHAPPARDEGRLVRPSSCPRDMGFGEGNFQALYDSIELDQKRRGVL